VAIVSAKREMAYSGYWFYFITFVCPTRDVVQLLQGNQIKVMVTLRKSAVTGGSGIKLMVVKVNGRRRNNNEWKAEST
jgi:hypothetical protein